MGRPYSTDLRERVLLACEAGEESQAAIARRFQISENTVSSWLRQLRQEGRREPQPHGRGFASVFDGDGGAVLRALVAENNEATLAEYAAAFTARTGEKVSASNICRALQRQGLVRKKRRFGRVSNTDPMLPPHETPIAGRSPWSTRSAWCSSTSRGS